MDAIRMVKAISIRVNPESDARACCCRDLKGAAKICLPRLTCELSAGTGTVLRAERPREPVFVDFRFDLEDYRRSSGFARWHR